MTGHLQDAIRQLLAESVPTLLGGATPRVQLLFGGGLFTIDPNSVDAEAGEPRIGDKMDLLPWNAASPAGPYTLTQPPAPGARRIWLTTTLGDRIPLTTAEVHWDPVNSQQFTLELRPARDLAGVNGVQVLYGVTAVFVKIKAVEEGFVQFASDNSADLEQAEALALAVLALNRKRLAEQASQSFQDGDYGAQIALKSLTLVKGMAPAAAQRQIHFSAEVELNATRALRADEGVPIRRIISPGRGADPARVVDITAGVDA